MRLFMIVLEFLAFLPPLKKVLDAYYSKQSHTLKRVYLLVILMLPPLVYIDHGHFQPNSVMHGLVLWGVYFMFKGQIEKAVVAMVLAVHFKQMALYFGLPFGIYALALIYKSAKIKHKDSVCKQIGYALYRLILLLIVFILTNLMVFYPILSSSGIPGV